MPVPGAVFRDGFCHANCETPGLALRCTLDGRDPDSPLYHGAVPLPRGGVFKVACFTTAGRRGRGASVAG